MPKNSRICSLIVLQLAASHVMADTAADVIARCAASISSEARVACLEEVIRDMSGEPVAAHVVAGEPEPLVAEPVPAPAAEVSQSAAEPILVEASTVVIAATSVEPEEVTAREPEAPLATTSATEDIIAEPIPELGAEQVAMRKGNAPELPRIKAVVVSHSEVGYQKLRVRLDNGQTWQQTDGDRIRAGRKVRNAPTFEVELWKTKSGGYRMNIPSMNMTLRMRRLE